MVILDETIVFQSLKLINPSTRKWKDACVILNFFYKNG